MHVGKWNEIECTEIEAKGDAAKNGSCHSLAIYNNDLFVFGGWNPR
jgi:hypothetical protein